MKAAILAAFNICGVNALDIHPCNQLKADRLAQLALLLAQTALAPVV